MKTFFIWYGLAISLSVIAIIGCAYGAVSLNLLYLIASSYVAWFFIGYQQWNIASGIVSKSCPMIDRSDGETEGVFSNENRYFFRLLMGVDESSQKLAVSVTNTRQLLERMDKNVRQAQDLAKNTKLLAVNAMVSAVRCGNVGRGFVSVTKDMAGISDQAKNDLLRLSRLIQRLDSNLSSVDFLPESAALTWLQVELGRCQGYSLTVERCLSLQGSVTSCADVLDELYCKYESTSQLDVRWLQLGEVIRRIVYNLRDIIKSLLSFVGIMIANVRLLNLSEGIDRKQLLKIQKGFLQFIEQHDKMSEITS